MKCINFGWFMFMNQDVQVNFFAVFFSDNGGVHIGKKKSLISIELFDQKDIFCKLFRIERLLSAAKKAES